MKLQDISWWQTDQGLDFGSQKPVPRSEHRWHRALTHFKTMGKIKIKKPRRSFTKMRKNSTKQESFRGLLSLLS